MKKETKKLLGVVIRYLVLLVVAFPNLWLFYFIFTPLTIYPVYFLLNIFYDVSLTGNFLTFALNGYVIELIGACIAGSAYYLLLMLNLTTPIKINKRLKLLLFSFVSLLALNILRIVFLSILFVNDFLFFDFTHKLFWYALSIIFVVGIWFIGIKLFDIKAIPLYSDYSDVLAFRK